MVNETIAPLKKGNHALETAESCTEYISTIESAEQRKIYELVDRVVARTSDVHNRLREYIFGDKAAFVEGHQMHDFIYGENRVIDHKKIDALLCSDGSCKSEMSYKLSDACDTKAVRFMQSGANTLAYVSAFMAFIIFIVSCVPTFGINAFGKPFEGMIAGIFPLIFGIFATSSGNTA